MFSVFSWYFLSLRGRISRQEFRLGYFGLVFASALLIRILLALTVPAVRYYSDRRELDYAGHWPILFVILITMWPLAAICVKRLHDLNLSGWWMLSVFFLSYVSSLIHVSEWIIVMLGVALLCLIPGASGSNRFGHDPLARPSPTIGNLA